MMELPMRRAHLCLAAALLFTASAALRAERVQLEKPVQISTVKADRRPLDGKLIAYDDEGFELARGKDKTVTVRWSELAAPGVYNVMSSIVGPRATGDDWVEVGRAMLRVDGGESFADRAFARAVKLDAKLQPVIDEARQSAATMGSAAPVGAPGSTPAVRKDPAQDNAADAPNAGGPQMVGGVQKGAWPPLTEEQRAARVAELREFAGEAGKKLRKELALEETKYFLFYSDLPPDEAANWAGLLDRMYARLAELFAVEREPRAPGAGRGDYANIWSGKALVFVFREASDYHRFEQVVHNTPSEGTAGLCHCFGDGRVHIAFFRQADPLTFAHVLVHESVHGFIHRFRTAAHVPSWVNEGLAEVIASELVPRNGRAKQRELQARQQLERRADLGGMMDAKHIDSWAYPVAETLCAYMIRQNKRNYVDFIAGIKEGLTWEQSLEQRYKAPRDRLARAYREAIGLKK
jgi:hypothetical protein